MPVKSMLGHLVFLQAASLDLPDHGADLRISTPRMNGDQRSDHVINLTTSDLDDIDQFVARL